MNQKQEAVSFMSNMQELWMDKLCQEETDKQWNKMKEQWEKEEVSHKRRKEYIHLHMLCYTTLYLLYLTFSYKLTSCQIAKIELMKQVYKERENAIIYKQNVREKERVELKKERDTLDLTIKEHYEKLEKLRIEEEKRRKSHQSDLLYQIENKKQHQAKEHQDALYNERAAKMWEAEFTKKLQDQKDIHKKRVNTLIIIKMEMIKKQGI